MLAKIKVRKERIKANHKRLYWSLRITGILIMLIIFFFLHAKEIEKGIQEWKNAEDNKTLIIYIERALMDEVKENSEAFTRLIGIQGEPHNDEHE